MTGRIDDMINISGHLLSTAEVRELCIKKNFITLFENCVITLLHVCQVESALMEHPAVAENAAVGRPHAVKGQCIHCFVTLVKTATFTPEVRQELVKLGNSRS